MQRQSKPDAITVLERAHEAIDAVDTFRFHSRRTLMGSLSSRAPSIEADVRAGRLEGDERFPWKIVIEGEAAASAERGAHGFVFAYDGKSVTAGDSAERIARVSSPKTIFTAAKPNAIVAANWLLRWDQLVRDPIIEKKFTHIITYDGEAMVDGELCHVVRMELSEFPQVDEYEFWWFISAEDYLPRRTDALYYDVGGVGTGFESIVITGLEADGPMRESELRLTIPSGYTVEEVKEEEVAALERQRDQAYAVLDEAESILKDLTITAPTSGTVTTRMVEGGEVVGAGAPLLELVDLDQLYLKVYVPEVQIGKVRLDLPARIYTDAFPDRPFEATVRYIASKAEFTPKEVQTPDERVKLIYAVKLYLKENPEHRLTPGLPADAMIRWKDDVAWVKPKG